LPAASPHVLQPSPAEALEETLREAGGLALRHFGNRPRQWKKEDGTPVSEADLAVDDLLRARLARIDAGAAWLSEESADAPAARARPRCWIVDPIDGTSSFLAGGDNWSVVAALGDEGRPVLAGIYRPVTNDYFSAALGHGAFRNGERLHVSMRHELAGARIITRAKTLQPERWRQPWPAVEAGMVTSLALRLCLVADASFDAAFALGRKSDWDLAAGDLIVNEAGGRVSDLGGDTLCYNRAETRQNGFVAAAPGLFAAIVARTSSL